MDNEEKRLRKDQRRERLASDPEYRERVRAQNRESERRRREDPEYRERIKAKRNAYARRRRERGTEGTVRAREARRRKRAEDPDWAARENARRAERHRQQAQDPEHAERERTRKRIHKRGRMEDPKYRAREQERKAAYAADPEVRAKAVRRWGEREKQRREQDPEYRAQQNQIQLDYSRRRKQPGWAIPEGSVCALCGSSGGDTRHTMLVRDHDHETNELRDPLCGACNKALGIIEKDIDWAVKAIQYIDGWKKVHKQ